MGDEAISAVNANSDKARNRAKLEARMIEAQAVEAVEQAHVAYKANVARARRKANRQFIIRTVLTILVCALIWLAGFFGLMDVRLSVPLAGAVGAWFAFWFGAWVQFMWAKGGLLNVEVK